MTPRSTADHDIETVPVNPLRRCSQRAYLRALQRDAEARVSANRDLLAGAGRNARADAIVQFFRHCLPIDRDKIDARSRCLRERRGNLSLEKSNPAGLEEALCVVRRPHQAECARCAEQGDPFARAGDTAA